MILPGRSIILCLKLILGVVDFSYTSHDLAGNYTITTESITGEVIFDRTLPELSEVSISSDNAYDNSLAMVGDQITVSFLSNEDILTPVVTISGLEAEVNGDGAEWTAARVMTDSDIDGDIGFTINYSDLASNSGVEVVSTLDETNVRFDNTQPVLSSVSIVSNNDYDSSRAKVLDEVTISFTSDEDVQTPGVFISGLEAEVTGDGTEWIAVRSMTNADDEGSIDFSVDFLDLAGNAGEQNTTTTDASEVIFDRTAPTLPAISIESDNMNYTDLAKVGDRVTITFTSDEEVRPCRAD